jgi:hypothetical protein
MPHERQAVHNDVVNGAEEREKHFAAGLRSIVLEQHRDRPCDEPAGRTWHCWKIDINGAKAVRGR